MEWGEDATASARVSNCVIADANGGRADDECVKFGLDRVLWSRFVDFRILGELRMMGSY